MRRVETYTFALGISFARYAEGFCLCMSGWIFPFVDAEWNLVQEGYKARSVLDPVFVTTQYSRAKEVLICVGFVNFGINCDRYFNI